MLYLILISVLISIIFLLIFIYSLLKSSKEMDEYCRTIYIEEFLIQEKIDYDTELNNKMKGE